MSDSHDPWADFECRARPPDVTACADPRELDERYVYLLGIYLGDGTLSLARRDVWRLRVFQDKRYAAIVAEIERAIESIVGRPAGRVAKEGCVEIYTNWKHWLCLFPQHGPRHKHERPITLATWQRQLVDRFPRAMLRGLIHSDGCRVINRVRRPTHAGTKTYEYPRYFFSNVSADIREIFALTCARLGVRCGPANPRNLTVARSRDVAFLDTFIGPKR